MANKILEIIRENNYYNIDGIKLTTNEYNMVKDNIIEHMNNTEANLPEDILYKIGATNSYKVLLRIAKNNPDSAKNIYMLCALCKMLCQLDMQFPTDITYTE